MTSPTLLVKDAMSHGAASREAIARRTKLNPGTVDLVLERLERSGELYRELLTACSPGGCGSCMAAQQCCGLPSRDNQQTPREPGLLLLKLRDAL